VCFYACVCVSSQLKIVGVARLKSLRVINSLRRVKESVPREGGRRVKNFVEKTDKNRGEENENFTHTLNM